MFSTMTPTKDNVYCIAIFLRADLYLLPWNKSMTRLFEAKVQGNTYHKRGAQDRTRSFTEARAPCEERQERVSSSSSPLSQPCPQRSHGLTKRLTGKAPIIISEKECDLL